MPNTLPVADVAGQRLRVRVLQTAPMLGDVDGNLARLDAAVAAAADRDLVLTPELATHGYDLGRVPEVLPLSLSDPRLVRLGQHGPAVVVGTAVRALHGQYNAAVLVGGGAGSRGAAAGSQGTGSRGAASGAPADPVSQHKITLPTYGRWEERKHFVPGGRVRVTDVSLGGGGGGSVRVATLICNDAWQPQLAWIAAQQGAEVLLAPSNSVISEVGMPTSEAWDTQLRGLAVSLQCYIVFSNRVGEEPCGRFWGGSAAYGPSGEVLARADDSEGVLDVDLDLAHLRELRRRWPFLRESRADVVLRETQRLLDREAEDV
ncbi:amidohydrolase [Leucobacter viscericola]|uniref:Amidohydrolase n=1 Tax=Leucobacter viscericola TaxID=2714935 RepID=A0A6G7XFB0_9MICO|nr:nitrilase-related carbon-nitrogen hydrolase [Leucobacter viscericola]QIK63300.1 amidohydrolase [Leucobacter viscericola]